LAPSQTRSRRILVSICSTDRRHLIASSYHFYSHQSSDTDSHASRHAPLARPAIQLMADRASGIQRCRKCAASSQTTWTCITSVLQPSRTYRSIVGRPLAADTEVIQRQLVGHTGWSIERGGVGQEGVELGVSFDALYGCQRSSYLL